MIKLNDKNITYVALADSPNSIKAPKEIWYADSTNSVKLVYRRKDALIEGEDYEKYHFMRVVVNDTSSSSVAIYLPINSSTFNYTSIIEKGKNIGHLDTNGYWYYTLDATNKDIRVWDKTNGMTTENTNVGSNVMVFNSNSNEFTVNNIQITKYGFPVKGKFFYCKGELNGSILTSPISVDGSTKYVPVKLLKSVPKWLDANGIRRNVGDCGMIDLETGKFRGTTNDYGTISVVNYYERKEWLIGDGSAYIEGINYNLWTNQVELKVGKINVTTTQNNELHYKSTEGNGNVWAVQQNPTLTTQFICIFRESGINVHIVSVDSMPSQVTLSFYQNGGYAYCLYNDTENKGNILNQSSWDTDITPKIFSYKMSYIREVLPDGSYRSNLIPCTLTMDLPASMDANNIARTKGTSGMWDLVSDRFYGNVANSGTFKAVNLAEEVDYEVHQWLKTGSGNPYIQVDDTCNIDANAYIETTYKCNYSNGGFDMAVGFSVNQNNNIGIRIFNTANGTFVDYHKIENGVLSSYRVFKTQSSINAERYIKATLDNLIIDTTEYPTINWGSGFDSVNYPNTRLLTNSDNNDVRFKRTKIRVNFKELDLIPVKLLRSIPAKYDANGIARQAGECGMYDTVNDLFYGNVASSGNFTVEDDS